MKLGHHGSLSKKQQKRSTLRGWNCVVLAPSVSLTAATFLTEEGIDTGRSTTKILTNLFRRIQSGAKRPLILHFAFCILHLTDFPVKTHEERISSGSDCRTESTWGEKSKSDEKVAVLRDKTQRLFWWDFGKSREFAPYYLWSRKQNLKIVDRIKLPTLRQWAEMDKK